jgi:predicted  nucleic acid-binding Zn-ribbon protein
MDWKLGDTQDLKEWIEKLAGSSAERKAEISDLRNEICQIRQSIDTMQKKVDNIERILEKVAE